MASVTPIRLNVCILPPPDVAQLVVKLASQLTAEKQIFQVDGHLRLPHVTLYSAVFPLEAVDRVAERLKMLPQRRPINCNAYGVTASSNEYVEIGYNKSVHLTELHASVTAAIAEFRLSGQEVLDASMSEVEAVNERAFGYKQFGDAYRPHITLAAYQGANQIPLPSGQKYSEFDFGVDTMALGESDEYGSVVRIIQLVS